MYRKHFTLRECHHFFLGAKRGVFPTSEWEAAKLSPTSQDMAQLRAAAGDVADIYDDFLRTCVPSVARMHALGASRRVSLARGRIAAFGRSVHPEGRLHAIDESRRREIGERLDYAFGTGFFSAFAGAFEILPWHIFFEAFLDQFNAACPPSSYNVLLVLDEALRLVDGDSSAPVEVEAMKSNAWMALLAVTGASALAKIDDILVVRAVAPRTYDDLQSYRPGTNFILCDDAAYSGTQMYADVSAVAAQMPRGSKISVVLGAATTAGQERILQSARDSGVDVRLQVGLHLRTFGEREPGLHAEYGRYAEVFRSLPDDFGIKSVDILDHKLADWMSTYPDFLLGNVRLGDQDVYVLENDLPMISNCSSDAVEAYTKQESGSCMLAWYKDHLRKVDMVSCLFDDSVDCNLIEDA